MSILHRTGSQIPVFFIFQFNYCVSGLKRARVNAKNNHLKALSEKNSITEHLILTNITSQSKFKKRLFWYMIPAFKEKPMSINLISKPIIDQELESLKIRCNKLKKNGIIPNLQILLVGNNKASKIYTNRKKKFCESFGAKCDIHHLDENISVNDIVIELNKISSAANVHGAFVQLPLPKHLANLEIEKLIPAEKDVDGFHPFNLFSLLSDNKKNDYFRPCTPYGVMSLLKYYNISVSGKHAVIIGRSMIVGKPMQMLLTNANATVTL